MVSTRAPLKIGVWRRVSKGEGVDRGIETDRYSRLTIKTTRTPLRGEDENESRVGDLIDFTYGVGV